MESYSIVLVHITSAFMELVHILSAVLTIKYVYKLSKNKLLEEHSRSCSICGGSGMFTMSG